MPVIVECPNCETNFEFDARSVKSASPSFKCGECGYVFLLPGTKKQSGGRSGGGKRASAAQETFAFGAGKTPKAGSEAVRDDDGYYIDERPRADAATDALDDGDRDGYEADASGAEDDAVAVDEEGREQDAAGAHASADSEEGEGWDEEGDVADDEPIAATDEQDSVGEWDASADEDSGDADGGWDDEEDESVALAVDDVDEFPSDVVAEDADGAADSAGEEAAVLDELEPLAAARPASDEEPRSTSRGRGDDPPRNRRASGENRRRVREPKTERTPFTLREVPRGWLALCVSVAAAYCGLTVILLTQPVAADRWLAVVPGFRDLAASSILARKLVVSDLEAHYQLIGDRETAFVVRGHATSTAFSPLQDVEVLGRLHGPEGQVLAEKSIYLGVAASVDVLGDLDTREVTVHQRIKPPPRFSIKPGRAAPFTLVFIDPPDGVAQFTAQVTSARAIER